MRSILSLLRTILLKEIPVQQPVSRLTDLDAARGLAIILVVVGHVVARGAVPLDNEWYLTLQKLIYRFHMPFFMCLAGITFALALPQLRCLREVTVFSKRRVARLLIPYLFVGLVVLVGKLIAGRFLHVDNPPAGTSDDVLRILLYPVSSVAGFLWFIYVLAAYLLAVPALFRFFGRRPLPLLLFGLLLQLVPVPMLFMLDMAVWYLPFFAGGMALWIWRSRWERMTDRATAIASALFLLALIFALPFELPKWLVGLLSIPAMLAWAQRLTGAWQSALVLVGRNSFAIYLFNTMAIGVSKGLMLTTFSWNGVNFLVYFPILVLAGTLLPMLLKRLLCVAIPAAARFL